MRVTAAFFTFIVLLAGLAGLSRGQGAPMGLYVEGLTDSSAVRCPYCHRAIVPGRIHQNAEDVISTEMGGSLEERGIPFTRAPGQARYLQVLIYRFQEREGGNFSVVRPASVGFHVHLFEGDKLIDEFIFDETQQPLSDNIFRFFDFLRRGAKWVTAGDLAREGIHKAIDALAGSLEGSAEKP